MHVEKLWRFAIAKPAARKQLAAPSSTSSPLPVAGIAVECDMLNEDERASSAMGRKTR